MLETWNPNIESGALSHFWAIWVTAGSFILHYYHPLKPTSKHFPSTSTIHLHGHRFEHNCSWGRRPCLISTIHLTKNMMNCTVGQGHEGIITLVSIFKKQRNTKNIIKVSTSAFLPKWVYFYLPLLKWWTAYILFFFASPKISVACKLYALF